MHVQTMYILYAQTTIVQYNLMAVYNKETLQLKPQTGTNYNPQFQISKGQKFMYT